MWRWLGFNVTQYNISMVLIEAYWVRFSIPVKMEVELSLMDTKSIDVVLQILDFRRPHLNCHPCFAGLSDWPLKLYLVRPAPVNTLLIWLTHAKNKRR